MDISNAAASIPNAVWAERVDTRQYIGRNSPSAEVHIGMGPGEFSPDELMEITLITCDTLSAGHRLARILGEDLEATMGCLTVKNDAEEHYESFQVEIITDLSPPDAEQHKLLSQRVAGAVDRYCAVSRTVKHDVSYITTIVGPNED